MVDASVEQPGMELYVEGDDIGNTVTRSSKGNSKGKQPRTQVVSSGVVELIFYDCTTNIHIKILSMERKTLLTTMKVGESIFLGHFFGYHLLYFLMSNYPQL